MKVKKDKGQSSFNEELIPERRKKPSKTKLMPIKKEKYKKQSSFFEDDDL